ncbi:hypothetical protein [Flavobacteriaceae bacterium 14752]|uniref:hypothetical protein n=1 Tax=Mesohalobacter salilacus TaxID=2491711 RepID=UPI000F6411CC|nr:hypothetical protein EIG84_02920 [Flavobacteriaceae bacterium 14752]
MIDVKAQIGTSAQTVVHPIEYSNNFDSGLKERLGFSPEKDYYDHFLATAKTYNSSVVGDIYLDSSFSDGKIISLEENTSAKANLRYNIYDDCFELSFNTKSQNYKQLTKSDNYAFIINDEKFVLIESQLLNPELPKESKGYIVEILPYNSNIGLFKKYQINFELGVHGVTNYYKTQNSKIENTRTYFLKINNSFKQIKLSKNKIANLFQESSDDVKSYIKHKKFKFKGSDKDIEMELIQVVRYYKNLKNN